MLVHREIKQKRLNAKLDSASLVSSCAVFIASANFLAIQKYTVSADMVLYCSYEYSTYARKNYCTLGIPPLYIDFSK